MSQTAASVRPTWQLLRNASYSVVLVNTVTIPTWLLIARLRRRRVICHVHEAEKSRPLVLRVAMSLPLLAANRVIVNSRFNLTVLTSSLPILKRRTRVLYNGIAGPPTVTAPRPELLPPIRLLFIGRLSPRKGPQVAIAALAQLLAVGLEARLDILGAVFEGYEWFEELLRRQVAEARVSGYVRFLGFRSDVWPDIAASDIVLVPSTAEESFGNTAVEAMLAGRPLVVSSTSGLLEAAKGYRSARFVEPGRPDLVGAAVREITGQWHSTCRWAMSDADMARQRHAPERFHTELAAIIAEFADAAS